MSGSGRSGALYREFLSRTLFAPTADQDALYRDLAEFLTGDDGDIHVVNGYAGTGKTTAVAAVVATLEAYKVPCVLLAPTGRAAKVLSAYTGLPAFTIHKHIYRQRSHGDDGFGQFSLSPNKARGTLFVVDEVSLIGIGDTAEKGAAFGSGNLLEDLVAFVRAGIDCRLLLVGDSAQLPPVGLDCSPALSPELMKDFGGVRFSTLTEVVRQERESGILKVATRVRELITGAMPSTLALSELALPPGGPELERISGGELLETLSDAYGKWGEDETIVLCRSNKRAVRYNAGIRAQVLFREERLVRDDSLMIVKNCYQFLEGLEGIDFLANGDIVKLEKIRHYEDRYGLHFADATLRLPDYGDQELRAKVLLDTLESESASLTYEQSNRLYQGVDADYSHITSRKKRYDAVREDPFYNALQLKYAAAITGHKSQGGQWKCVFIDNPFWQEELQEEDLKWLYTAITRGVEKVYLVNFKDALFQV